jgi:DNA polymerase Ligase (LigD)
VARSQGPTLDPALRRLPVPVEDHSLEAADFEGVHQGQARGSGAVIIWDEGPAQFSSTNRVMCRSGCRAASSDDAESGTRHPGHDDH